MAFSGNSNYKQKTPEGNKEKSGESNKGYECGSIFVI